MKTVFTIATETSECYGHGDYGTELQIVQGDIYGSVGFPPVFLSKKSAERYLAKNKASLRLGTHEIVELSLRQE